jgi:predicted small lipoprotein YifL
VLATGNVILTMFCSLLSSGKFGVPYFETSAKESTNVELAFQTLVGTIVDSDKQNAARGPSSAPSSAQNTPREGGKKDKKDKKDCVIS